MTEESSRGDALARFVIGMLYIVGLPAFLAFVSYANWTLGQYDVAIAVAGLAVFVFLAFGFMAVFMRPKK